MGIKIFVEGIADKRFLFDYIFHSFNIQLGDEDIIEAGGWTKINAKNEDDELIKNKMFQNSDNDGINIIIFDADKDFDKRKSEINEWKNKQNLNFELFLWPNNKDVGDLEVTLENIITPQNKPIFDCWHSYEKCLASKKIEGREIPLTTPARKTKIYGYLEALLGESKSQKKKIKEANRDYRIQEHWDLNSTYLKELKEFLSQCIK
jgi:hypothetical protein